MTLTPAERKARHDADSAARRFQVGVIATMVGPDGAVTVKHFLGVKADATRQAIDHCDRYGLKISTLCTPETITRDLRGPRVQHYPGGRHSDGGWHVSRGPEDLMLGQLGRRDLLDG